jgi:hypothetical protein
LHLEKTLSKYQCILAMQTALGLSLGLHDKKLTLNNLRYGTVSFTPPTAISDGESFKYH